MIAVFYILLNNYQTTYHLKNPDGKDSDKIKIELAQQVTFLNKASILNTLNTIPDNSKVEIDASNTLHMHYDIYEIIEDFRESAPNRNIDLQIHNLHEPEKKKSFRAADNVQKDEDAKEVIH